MTAPSNPTVIRRMTYLGVAGLAFQVGHFGEHLAQFGYWVLHPTATPWLSPWAIASRDVLSADPAFGVELLHLVGNVVFLLGLLLLMRLPAAHRIHNPMLRTAAALQLVHVAEHVLLTLTRAWTGSAIGFSTAFGYLQGGQLSSYRVLWHFVVNLIVTAYAVRAVSTAVRGGLVGDLTPATG